GSQLFWFAVGVAVIAWLLVLHYNNRMKNTRNDSVTTEKYLLSNGVDFAAITGFPPKRVSFFYDWQELVLFFLILCASVIPAFIVFWKSGNRSLIMIRAVPKRPLSRWIEEVVRLPRSVAEGPRAFHLYHL